MLHNGRDFLKTMPSGSIGEAPTGFRGLIRQKRLEEHPAMA